MAKNKKRSPVVFILLGLVLLAVGLMLIFGRGIITKLRDASLPLSYKEEIRNAAHRYGLEPAFVAAVVKTESGFDPRAVSGDGAVGLMQVLPSTGEWIAWRRGLEFDSERLYDPEYNLDYGCWLLSFLLERYDGNEKYALIAYNAGYGRLDEWLKTRVDENGELTDIPYAETRNYVDRIGKLKERYGEVYGTELDG
ncbi:MAG: lytic transglycosylase domain-containing protein [Clostridiales bacterium]|nr:lytic transglycosylase domain-containing protein [Clostridiales bacterium]